MFRGITNLVDIERRVIKWFVKSSASSTDQVRVLDVGCGYGRNLEWLTESGYAVLGIDVNPYAVAANKLKGLNCITVNDFIESQQECYDVILMSHFVEHFAPESLIRILDDYLNALKPGGVLVIATPLYTSYFFEDLTHVRPYHPESILMAYGKKDAQISIRSNHRLSLTKIWFRRSPMKIRNVASCYRERSVLSVRTWLDALFVILFVVSGGLFGVKDGWVGVFEKQ